MDYEDGYVSLKFRGEFQSGDENLGIISMKMVFKAIILEEISMTEYTQIRYPRTQFWGPRVFNSVYFIWNHNKKHSTDSHKRILDEINDPLKYCKVRPHNEW